MPRHPTIKPEWTCLYCGKKFRAKPRSKTRTRKFCNQSCRYSYTCGGKNANWRGGKGSKNCEWCGKPFQYVAARKVARFCSVHCYHESTKRPGRDIRHREMNTRKYKDWRKAVLLRDGNRCCRCGSTEGLHAHHIKSYKDHPSLRYTVENGITLCESHHYEAHGRMARGNKRRN